MTVVIPYPSADMCEAKVAYDCMRLLNDNAKGIDRFVFAVGSDRSRNAVTRLLEGTTRDFARIGIHLVREKAYNGTSASLLCLRSCTDALPDEKMLLFVPPWWHVVAGSGLDVSETMFDGGMPDDVVSVMLAGWFWTRYPNTNFVPRKCKYGGYVAVQSVQGIDKFILNPNAPQIVNSRFFREGGIMRECSVQALEDLCDRSYWGMNDVDMVLVPKEQRPFFKDVLNTNPVYGT